MQCVTLYGVTINYPITWLMLPWLQRSTLVYAPPQDTPLNKSIN